MSPLKTAKFLKAVEVLEKIGLVPSAIQALSDAGGEALYRELSRRGYVWGIDPERWRKSKKPRNVPAAIIKSGYLEHAQLRIIVRTDETDFAIAEFASIMANFGYEITRVAVHTGRNIGEVLIYCTIHRASNGHG